MSEDRVYHSYTDPKTGENVNYLREQESPEEAKERLAFVRAYRRCEAFLEVLSYVVLISIVVPLLLSLLLYYLSLTI